VPDAIAYAACAAAIKTSARAIIACTETGTSARLVAKYRPQQPLYGLSRKESALRKMALYWGVHPISFASGETHLDEIDTALKAVQDREGLPNNTRAVVTGAAFPTSLREWVAGRGIIAVEAYGTAELGLIAHTLPGEAGMRLAEGIIVEIVRPGTGENLPEGEIGEVLVTIPDPSHPIIRFSPGDMSALLPGGRAIRGWLGRADQTAKMRGMFIRPEQIAAIARAMPALGRLRLRITRQDEQDVMELLAEGQGDGPALVEALRAATGLRGTARFVPQGSLPTDGRVIDDAR
jgi:phenylacetate-CoA ligase